MKVSLVTKLQRGCAALGDHGDESALPTLWDPPPSIAVVGGQWYCFSMWNRSGRQRSLQLLFRVITPCSCWDDDESEDGFIQIVKTRTHIMLHSNSSFTLLSKKGAEGEQTISEFIDGGIERKGWIPRDGSETHH